MLFDIFVKQYVMTDILSSHSVMVHTCSCCATGLWPLFWSATSWGWDESWSFCGATIWASDDTSGMDVTANTCNTCMYKALLI